MARAHGPYPAAVSFGGENAETSVVRVTEGVATFGGDSWQYVCPTLWDGFGSDPVGMLPGGRAVLAASSGLFLLSANGTVVGHPDPLARGRGIALARADTSLFVLRFQENRYEIMEVTADAVQVLWSDAARLDDLAIGRDFVQAVGTENGQINQVRLTLRGAMLASEQASYPLAAYVFARAAGERAFIVVMDNSAFSELGQIEQGAWVTSGIKAGNVAGPIEAADGSVLIGVDGKLASLNGNQLSSTTNGTEFLRCLGRHGMARYACTNAGVRALEGRGLGAALFEMSKLKPPALDLVPEPKREQCRSEWQMFRFDLAAAGIQLSSDGPIPVPIAGASAGIAGSAGSSTAADAWAPSSSPANTSGCSALHGGARSARGLSVWIAGTLLWRRRRFQIRAG
jgi:hypothetical protein